MGRTHSVSSCDALLARLTLTERPLHSAIDREDILELATRLDDVLDFIEALSERLALYRIREPDAACKAFADVIVRIVDQVNEAVYSLRGKHQGFHEHAIEVNRLENAADSLLSDSLVTLFENSADPIEIIKWKELYELMEIITDRCEDVVNTIEVIILKAEYGYFAM